MKKSKLNTLQVAVVVTASIALPATALANQTDELKAQVDSLSTRLSELEQLRHADAALPTATATAPPNAVTGGATRGSFKLPGSDTSVTLGGYVKLDAIHSDRAAGRGATTGDQEYEAGAVPVGPEAAAEPRGQNLGLEYIHATREIENGQTGRLNRLQAAAQYTF